MSMHDGRLTLDKLGHEQSRGAWRRALSFVARIVGRDDSREIPSSTRSQHRNREFSLSQVELQRIIEAGRTPRDRAMIQIFCETGMRRAEVAELRIEDCRLGERMLIVQHGKGNKLRLIPLTTEMIAVLSGLIGSSPEGPVFPSSTGGHLSHRQINRIVADCGMRAGVSNPNPKYRHVTCHLFRHSFARLWKARGGSIESLSKILGHASVRTTWDEYGSESLEDVRRNYAKIMEGKSSRAGQGTSPTTWRRTK